METRKKDKIEGSKWVWCVMMFAILSLYANMNM